MVGIFPFLGFQDERIALSLLSTFSLLNWELFGISNLGEGGLKLNPSYVSKLRIFNPRYISKSMEIADRFSRRQFQDIFSEIGIDPSIPIREQEPNPLPDRAELDSIIFEELGLTQEERKEVYWSVCELVKQRLDKAKSLEKIMMTDKFQKTVPEGDEYDKDN